MKTNHSRDYNCKDEELPVICKFAAFSVKRDLVEFTDYSPKIDGNYVKGFEKDIATAMDLIEPQSETVVLKDITEDVHNAMDGLIDPINRVSGYLKLAKPGLKITPTDFGFVKLRRGIRSRDAEAVIDSLHLVNINLTKHKTALQQQGLTEALCTQFATAVTTVGDGKQQHYEIFSNRKKIVQNNIATFNDLYALLKEVLAIGKILYQGDAAKLQEYTLADLLKRVHRKISPEANDQNVKTN